MNKKLYLIKNIIFLANIVLLTICTSYGLPHIPGFNTVLIYPLVVILLILNAVGFIKNKKNINYNNQYNVLFIISNLIVMIIMLRGIFDNSIISNIMLKNDLDSQVHYRMRFVANNLIYFNIIYISLILYPLTIDKKSN